MTITYIPLATTTLGSDTASITFSNISASYTDLIAVCETKGNDANLVLRFNGDTGSNYSTTAVYATNTNTVGSFRRSSQTSLRNAGSAYMINTTNRLIVIYHIMNYANTTTNKTVLFRGGLVAAGVDLQAGLWRSTSAITSIEFIGEGSNLYAGSIVTLYGIKAE